MKNGKNIVIVVGFLILLISLLTIVRYIAEIEFYKGQLVECNSTLQNVTKQLNFLENKTMEQEEKIKFLEEQNENLTRELGLCHLQNFNSSRELATEERFKRFEPVEQTCRRWLLLEMYDCNSSESCMELGYRFCMPYLSDGISCPYELIGKYIWLYKSNLTKFDSCLEEENITCLNETAHNIQRNCLMYDTELDCSLGVCPQPNFNWTELVKASKYLGGRNE